MKQVALVFRSNTDLGQFELLVETAKYKIEEDGLIITGNFTEREIELAINAYNAKRIEVEIH